MGNKCTEGLGLYKNCLKKQQRQSSETKTKDVKNNNQSEIKWLQHMEIHSQKIDHSYSYRQTCQFRLFIRPYQQMVLISEDQLKDLQNEVFNSQQQKEKIIKKNKQQINEIEDIFSTQEQRPVIIKKKKSIKENTQNERQKKLIQKQKNGLMSAQLTKILGTIEQTRQSSIVRLSTSTITIQLILGKARAGPIIVPYINYGMYK